MTPTPVSMNLCRSLKINMLAEATKDATARAEQIVGNANGRLGKLVEARMGAMQINPKGVSATSAEGNNDTTSYEKEITAVVRILDLASARAAGLGRDRWQLTARARVSLPSTCRCWVRTRPRH